MLAQQTITKPEYQAIKSGDHTQLDERIAATPQNAFDLDRRSSQASRLGGALKDEAAVALARAQSTDEAARIAFEAWNKLARQPYEPEMVAIPGRNYEIGKYEVTQAQWRAVMGNNPSSNKGCVQCPVENVSWDDIQTYLTKLNQMTGKQYRLPTEAEWKYACDGGREQEYCGGNNLDAVGWYGSNSGGKTHPVGQKQANGYGLYDMTGNVWEWQQDCWEGNCGRRVLRGGSWDDFPTYSRAADRNWIVSPGRSYGSGFRPARIISP